YPIDRAPCLGRLVPPAIQQLEQRRLIRPEFLQRLPVDPRNDTGDQPDRLAHLNDGDQCAILIQSGERSAQVIWLRHGAPRRLFPATMMPCPRRSPHSISLGGCSSRIKTAHIRIGARSGLARGGGRVTSSKRTLSSAVRAGCLPRRGTSSAIVPALGRRCMCIPKGSTCRSRRRFFSLARTTTSSPRVRAASRYSKMSASRSARVIIRVFGQCLAALPIGVSARSHLKLSLASIGLPLHDFLLPNSPASRAQASMSRRPKGRPSGRRASALCTTSPRGPSTRLLIGPMPCISACIV